jgi:hypothetical protein
VFGTSTVWSTAVARPVPLESVTSIVKVEDPDPVGVPQLPVPSAGNVKPAGRLPLARVQVYGGVPPLAVSVAV